MNLEVFKRRYQLPLESLRQMIQEHVIQTGNKSEDCQQTCILNHLRQLEIALNGTTEDDLIAHAIFREPIADVEDAKRLFRYLHAHGMTFHPEDDPADVPGLPLSADECRELRHRMAEAWECQWSEYDCPCGFILHLNEQA